MKRFIAMFLLISLLLTACGGGQEAAAQETIQVPAEAPAETLATVPETTVPETTVPETTEATEPYVEPPVFNLVVRNQTLSDGMKREFRSMEKEKLKAENILIDDIPAIVVVAQESENRPITIFIHPAGGGKSGYMRQYRDWATATGGIAVGIDGGGWGTSPRGRMTDAETIAAMPSDLDKVIAYCSTLEGADMSRISLVGMSMGGTATLVYMAYGTFTPYCAYAGAPSADLSTFTEGSPYMVHGKGVRKGDFLTTEEIHDLLVAYSPINQVERMMDTNLMLEAGKLDAEHGVESCYALEEKFKEMGKENYQFNFYDAGHSYYPWDHDEGEDNILIHIENWLTECLESGYCVKNPIPVVTMERLPW